MRARQLDELGIDGYLARYRQLELLRWMTCGSVDDGKSTLLGRLLYDSQEVPDDVLDAAKQASQRFGTVGDDIDLALLVDGLQAEREQGITIDVAHRYFATERRKFVIADAPGHVQYTRNMATAASNSDLAVILVDARHGVLDQTRRHSFLSSLLGIQHFVVAINKMDLVGYSERAFAAIRDDYSAFAARLPVRDIHFLPMCALHGENVVRRAESMPWYQGSPLLDHLETVHVTSDRNLIDVRLPVQYVLRPGGAGRAYAGTLVSGVLRAGDPIVALPSGRQSRIASILTSDGPRDEAFASMAVTVTLADEIDVSRGDMLASPNNAPVLANTLEAMLVWFADAPLQPGSSYLVKHTTSKTPATVTDLRYRIDVDTLKREPAANLQINQVGRIRLECARPLAADAYAKNRATGAFLLIDRLGNQTVGAGMIVERTVAEQALGRRRSSADAASNVRRRDERRVSTSARQARLGQVPFVLWLTGLPRAGKSSVAYGLEQWLFEHQHHVQVLDGETLRAGLNRDLGFGGADRWENQRRAAEVARLNLDNGISTIVALVSPLEFERRQVRELVGGERFVELFCDAPLDVCEARDRDGLYAGARAGEIGNVTGIDAPYEPPTAPDLVLDTVHRTVDANVGSVVELLRRRGMLR
ncbi:MAG TPA: sulfate adenylyltransferase subunit CysN [Planctomycetota bacterium]|nr:sulfate adenylyltransferase subunit CysN [Planctomycetota bacterium]